VSDLLDKCRATERRRDLVHTRVRLEKVGGALGDLWVWLPYLRE
jgi:hypothetical protein